ncbi:LysE family translocator [Rhodoferax sp.]|uniref:LysE family translocator n=1 Tax=Rhodoferax sp. TaxID=50421 RepID=UPI0025D2B35D|nr:LysE family translocator [Rhodoferax sp.]
MLDSLGIVHLPLFIASGWLLNLTPGPDVFYILSNGLRGGWRAGVVAALGITAGCFVHIFAAAVGVSALITASATAFTVLKWLGAAYLVWVGIQMLRSPKPVDATDSIATPADQTSASGLKSLKKVFLQGFWTNALNPKVALFFLAFLPQFITPGAAQPTLAFVLLGLLFNLNAVPINLGYALLAAWAARRMGAVRRGMHWLERGAGALFVAFGLKLALSSTPNP